MAVVEDAGFQAVLDFWFSEQVQPKWFNSNSEFDSELRHRFQSLWQAAVRGEKNDWMKTADGCLALAIVLDQFPLNMYRDMALSFSSEAAAIEVSQYAINAGLDALLSNQRLAFLYMPLMHSENLQDQDRVVALFERAGLESNARFARHHRELIQQFGRFPHRNAILGRESTADELEYLQSKQAFLG